MTKPSVGNTGRHDLAGSADYFPGKNCCQRCGLWVSDIGKHINEKYCAGLGVAAPKEDSILWDRLRADLANLGAAYGELPVTAMDLKSYAYEPVTDTLTEIPPDEFEPATSQRRDSEPVEIWLTRTITEEEARERYPDAPTPVDNLSPTDRNAYFDGIILAARKKREKQNHYEGSKWSESDVKLFRQMEADYRNAETLSAAMSRPLDFEPRVGHKGVEIDG